MKAARVHAFGGPDVIRIDDVPLPTPGPGEVLVRVHAAGVGPWDSWVRSGKSVLPQPLPLTLGSDLAGVIETVNANVDGLMPGDEVFGVTNARFTNACAEYAIASAAMIAKKPRNVDWITAAGVPVVAVTAWQMLFEHANLLPGQTVVVLGGAGNVGAYAVQLAKAHGAYVVGTGLPFELEDMKRLGADEAIDVTKGPIESVLHDVDVVIDTLGAKVHPSAIATLRADGSLISSVAPVDPDLAQRYRVRTKFILVDVRTAVLTRIAELLDAGSLRARVGEVLGFDEVVAAHEMLDGKRPHKNGKIVLRVV